MYLSMNQVKLDPYVHLKAFDSVDSRSALKSARVDLGARSDVSNTSLNSSSSSTSLFINNHYNNVTDKNSAAAMLGSRSGSGPVVALGSRASSGKGAGTTNLLEVECNFSSPAELSSRINSRGREISTPRRYLE